MILPVHDAAYEGDLCTVEQLLRKDRGLLDRQLAPSPAALLNVDVQPLAAEACTPLMFAAYGGQAEVVAYLIDQGAQRELGDVSGCTAAHWACIADRREALAALLAKGCDANARDQEGWTPLFAAIDWGSRACALYLVGLGPPVVDVKATDRAGYTPLHYAAKRGDSELVAALLRAGADAAHSAVPGGPAVDGAVPPLTPLEMCQASEQPGAQACAALLTWALEEADRARLLLKARALCEAARGSAAATTPSPSRPSPTDGQGGPRRRKRKTHEGQDAVVASAATAATAGAGAVSPTPSRAGIRACLRAWLAAGLPLPGVQVTPEAMEATTTRTAEEAAAGGQEEREREREQLAAVAAYVVGAGHEGAAAGRGRGGGGGGGGGGGPALLRELYVELMELLVPEWDRDNC